MIRCHVHNLDVAGYKVVTEYAEIQGRMVRTVETYSFPCGCEFLGADIRTETVVDSDVSPDGVRIIELTINDLSGETVMSWMESREVADEF